ncbi:hypothetical protein Y032_0001g365 [Ancylostoma ceylanicum]|uniref:Uncharacterized protein n=1 Tax=Ancylostoma ceylanicum TaxID=53326 RepID=A0A016W3V9_9BILA|nr:hypothetical protein Y032_0001g365 [Ancylostoma ceylanicum]
MAKRWIKRRTFGLIAALTVIILILHVWNQEDGAIKEASMEMKPIPAECACSDNYNRSYDFCYTLPENRSIRGRRFSCEHLPKLAELGLLETSNLSFVGGDFSSDPVFVTAFSRNHAREAKNLIRTIKRYFGDRYVVVYDLGRVNTSWFKEWKFLEFRSFNFSEYPKYFRKLRDYRWKPIIIAKTLQEFGAIWYMDSSIVFKKGDLSHVYELVKCRRVVSERPPLMSTTQRDLREAQTTHEDGWNIEHWKENIAECRKAAYLMHGYTGHGIYPATSPEVYKFIPTNFTEIKKPKAKMYEAGFVFAVQTKDTIEEILKWYVLCALERDCMAGNGHEHLGCFFKQSQFSSSPTCHSCTFVILLPSSPQ